MIKRFAKLATGDILFVVGWNQLLGRDVRRFKLTPPSQAGR